MRDGWVSRLTAMRPDDGGSPPVQTRLLVHLPPYIVKTYNCFTAPYTMLNLHLLPLLVPSAVTDGSNSCFRTSFGISSSVLLTNKR